MVEVIEHKFSDNAIQMMEGRYLLEGETPKEMFKRVASGLAEVEREYFNDDPDGLEKDQKIIRYKQEFYDVMISGEFVPAGRTLTNVGIGSPVVPNCIVLPIEDTMDDIFKTLRDAALLQQAGSGIGFNFSKLRPADYETKRSRGKASGPVSFLQTYNDAFARIQQQGRHGANMAMMNINHPDILDFIRCKQVEGNIENFNISVLITDKFMKMLEDFPDTMWVCEWQDRAVNPREITRNRVGVIQSIDPVEITVKNLFNEIVRSAWNNGEPGVAFIDEINRTNPLPGLGDIDCSNPCGEQYLHAYDNCNLGSINLAEFVKEDKTIDYKELSCVTCIATRMLDNVIDTFDVPVKEVQDMALANRRIGLGVMGFADMLYQLGIPYDSGIALEISERVMKTISQAARITSRDLGKEKGVFLNQDKGVESNMTRRNAALTTVAPTGSISMLYDVSSGIEPNFALRYIKKVRTGDYVYVNKYFLEALKKLNLGEQGEENVILYVKNTGSLKNSGVILPKEFEEVFVTASDISIDAHINMQAKFQEYIDNSISKTINMPEDATEEDVRQAFIRGWRAKCKSLTVYRDNSRKEQVLNVENANRLGQTVVINDDEVVEITEESIQAIHDVLEADKIDREKVKRPKVVEGKNHKIVTAHGNMYVGIQHWDGKIYEVFTNVGKDGGCVSAYMSGITRTITLALRHGVPLAEIVEQLKDISCHAIWDDGVLIASPVDGIACALAHHIPEKEQDDYTRRFLAREKIKDSGGDIRIWELTKEQMTPKEGERTVMTPRSEDMREIVSEVCRICESTDMVRQEGCVRCLSCGDSRCG